MNIFDETDGFTQASLTDPLPSGVVLADSGFPLSQTAASGGTSLSLTFAMVPPNSTCSICVNVTAASSGIYSNMMRNKNPTSNEWQYAPNIVDVREAL